MLSVTILTKNSERYIEQVLESVKEFQEVILFDTGSQDMTIEIAKKFNNVTIYQEPFVGFGPTHNKASNKTTYDWVLSIDSDEIVSENLKEELLSLTLDKESVYSIERENYFQGKKIKGCGWYPDRVIRLYNKTTTSFSDDLVHEKVLAKDLHICQLKGTLYHYPYPTIGHFLTKMQQYSTLFAEQNALKKSGSFSKAILHGIFAFFKSYILKKGILLGSQGYIISLYNGHTAYYKYLKLAEVQKTKRAAG